MLSLFYGLVCVCAIILINYENKTYKLYHFGINVFNKIKKSFIFA